ncbi:MAG: glycosyltransferase family 1 protein [Candidatus Brocadiia bacterium]|nr:MAG: glycosyltransferase family 1 protein [Candidatus Brocadiia bacterium]
MKDINKDIGTKTLLVFNCHEPWVYQLGVLGYDLDIIVGLKGRHKPVWDEQMRPVPTNSRFVHLEDALSAKKPYYCIITHNISDLLDVKYRDEPRLLVIHSTMEGRLLEEGQQVEPEEMKSQLRQYLDLVGGHAVAVSSMKGNSWGFTEDIVPFGAESNDYYPYQGDKSCGLRICNFIESRRRILLWDFHEKAFGGLSVKLVGHNPGMAGVSASNNWEELKRMLQSHRFFIHTADPQLEDGYNMATVEAMSAGMPILGNNHPGSPIRHGISGFLSDDPAELRQYAELLLKDRDLAIQMGREARKTAGQELSLEKFKAGFLKSIETARFKSRMKKIL